MTRRDFLAAVYFMKQHRHHLHGKKFLLRTDHGAIARWLETLAIFDFDIEKRPGRQHGNADGLSRVPCHQFGIDGVKLICLDKKSSFYITA